MTHDTASQIARLKQMRADYDAMMAERKIEKPPEPPKDPNEFQKRVQAYADQIMEIETKDDRRIALQNVPTDCRGWVEIEVRLRYDKRKREATNDHET